MNADSNSFEIEWRDPRWLTPSGESSSVNIAQLLAIRDTGLALQKAIVSKDESKAADLAESLETQARTNTDTELANETIEPMRVAAAYHLWLYDAAIYYGHFSADTAVRANARKRLCRIQQILFANIRKTLDFLRTCFPVDGYEELISFLAGERRQDWRPSVLTDHAPDLCAVDSLVIDMIRIVRARPSMLKAMEYIHKTSLGVEPPNSLHPLTEVVREAFRTLGVAQITLFHHPNPEAVPAGSDLPLKEFVYESFEGDGDDYPDKLIPFFAEETFFLDGSLPNSDEDRHNFRRLATAIYTSSDDKPHFHNQRLATLDALHDVRFVSGGETTYQFLTAKPPIEKWPAWYQQTLAKLPSDPLADWTDREWWKDVEDQDAFLQQLFPNSNGSLVHANDHASAYWDYVAHNSQPEQFLDSWAELKEHVLSRKAGSESERFGYLMELLLRRRETHVRTSFFFAISQTYEHEDETKGRLAQFLGGTFLGLERPGVPYEVSRFRTVANYMRPLIFALAHFCRTRSVRQIQLKTIMARRDFESRIQRILDLMEGMSDEFNRAGQLLYTADHPNTIPYPSRPHVKKVFQPHWPDAQITAESPLSLKCDETWKALFCIPENSDQKTLQDFLSSPDVFDPMLPKWHVKCPECFKAAIQYILHQFWNELSDTCEIDPPFALPSRPGVRFLISVCDLINAIQEETSPESGRVASLYFGRGIVRIGFSPVGRIVEHLRRWNCPPSSSTQIRKTGHQLDAAFWRLKRCKICDEEKGNWKKFLCRPEFGGGYRLVVNAENLEIRWSE